jgi:DNA repair exonuclease SbcCD ATPase subunit
MSKQNPPHEAAQNGSQQVSKSDIDAFREMLDEAAKERNSMRLLVEYLAKNQESIDNKVTLFKRIEERFAGLEALGADLDKRLGEIKTASHTITEVNERAGDTLEILNRNKKETESVNRLVEHISSKIKALSLQRVIVERANEEAGKLNVLFWDMESRIKRLQEENKLVRKSEKNIVRLESMLETVSGRMEDVEKFKELLSESGERETSLRRMATDVENKMEILGSHRQAVEDLTADVRRANAIIETTQAATEDLVRQRAIVNETQREVSGLLQDINSMRVEVRNVLSKEDQVRKVMDRLADLEKLSANVETSLTHLREEDKRAKVTEARVNDLNTTLRDLVEDKMLAISEQLKLVETAQKGMDNFYSSAEEVDAKLRRFRDDLKVTDQIEAGLGRFEDMFESVNRRMEELAARKAIVEQVEHKISSLNDMVLNLDIKMENQLERRGLVEKLEKKLDGLDYLVEDANLKIDRVAKKVESIESLERKIDGFGEVTRSLENRILDIVKERSNVDVIEARMKSLFSQVSTSEDAVTAKLLEMENSSRRLDEIKRIQESVGPAVERTQIQIEEARRLVKESESIKGKVEDLSAKLADVESRASYVSSQDDRIMEMEKKLSYLNSLHTSIDERIVVMKDREEDIKRASEQVAGLFGMLNDIQSQRETLEKDKDSFRGIIARISSINEMMAEEEVRVDKLNSKFTLVTKLEQRLNDLSILAEDVKAKTSAIMEEEKTIERAGQQIVELKFLLGEIEKRLNEYFSLKGQA